MEQIVLYSEIFKSIQGEGHYTGVPTSWLRFFGCNLECNGFGQDDPTDPSTYKLPYKDFDLINIKNVEDLPVWKYGCDSSYSWSKKFAKIQKKEKTDEVARQLYEQMYNEFTHIAFTGGEPLMNAAQKNTVKILQHMENELMHPLEIFHNITWETNGTRALNPILVDYLTDVKERYSEDNEIEYFFSVSPKIWSTSGEKDAICPEIVKDYYKFSDKGQLKFVCNGTEDSWYEIEEAVSKFQRAGVWYPIWIMPVGATEESQQDNAKEITIQTMERGYNVAARVHCYIFGNEIGR
jgi:7-carboxy-7-deazaguanine synthase